MLIQVIPEKKSLKLEHSHWLCYGLTRNYFSGLFTFTFNTNGQISEEVPINCLCFTMQTVLQIFGGSAG